MEKWVSLNTSAMEQFELIFPNQKKSMNISAEPLPFPVTVGHATEVIPKRDKNEMAGKKHSRLPVGVIYKCISHIVLSCRFLQCAQTCVITCGQFCAKTDLNDQCRPGENWDSDIDLRSTYKVTI